MTTELTVLSLAALLWVAQFVAYLTAGHGKIDLGHAIGPRDKPFDKPGVSGRLHRALGNHTEGLVLFGIAALVLTVSNQSNNFTATCSWVYLIARLLYVPAYAFGWTPWRTVIWIVGLAATTAMLLAAVL
ncbi:MAPEG family protein [Ruegeria sp. Ofav3-42]|uniref:MAPEG family protein n=1 Tax=Ruegeria sp. Ofav3-42 TaxID=2917759 RepID=UPI001EF4C180|nr:MAPEG family protein [Ruegeria sp. Ofav3-42]MCG7520190.1 MAPEG family protein [Ruegeria sp. Ofav3-42]